MTEPKITPPPELVQQWQKQWRESTVKPASFDDWMLTCAAQWGADQELEACCEWLSLAPPAWARDLRAARRPKPLSLKERLSKAIVEGDERQALKLLEELDDSL